MKVTHNYNSLLDDYNQLIKEQEVLTQENKELIEDIEELRSDFKVFKSRYEDIYSREILEVFNLETLWQETFRQELTDGERVIIATEKFRPDNIIVGQGYIAAETRQKAIEWLNIVRTALIFVDDNLDDLKKDLNEKTPEEVPEDNEEYEISNAFENFWD